MCTRVGFFCEFGFAMEAVSEATEATVAGECYFGRRETLFGESVLLGGRIGRCTLMSQVCPQKVPCLLANMYTL